MNRRRQKIFKIWANALGPKSAENQKVADHVAWVRTFIFVTYFVTNCFIVAGVIRHWNDAF
jgi:hypothetical protein